MPPQQTYLPLFPLFVSLVFVSLSTSSPVDTQPDDAKWSDVESEITDVLTKLHLAAPSSSSQTSSDSSSDLQLPLPLIRGGASSSSSSTQTDSLSAAADLAEAADTDIRTPSTWDIELDSETPPSPTWTEKVLLDLRRNLEVLRDRELMTLGQALSHSSRSNQGGEVGGLKLGSSKNSRSSSSRSMEKRYRPSGFMGSRGKRFMPGLESLLLAKYYRDFFSKRMDAKWKRQPHYGFHGSRG